MLAAPVVPNLNALLNLSVEELARVDIAIVNMQCAEGLSGAEKLDIGQCLGTLGKWTDAVRRYSRDSYGDYQREPERYKHQRGYFRFLSMVTLLKHPKAIGIGYQPSAVGNMRFIDSRDDLIHGLLTRKLGTCASLPVLFVAIGRRLGWPMHLAVSKGHVICQWINDDGTRINLEGSCGGGGNMFPDEHYHNYHPYEMNQHEIESGRYLRPLTRAEEFALFLETRGHCLTDNGRREEAREAYDHAKRIAPNFSHWANQQRLDEFVRMATRRMYRDPVPAVDALGRGIIYGDFAPPMAPTVPKQVLMGGPLGFPYRR